MIISIFHILFKVFIRLEGNIDHIYTVSHISGNFIYYLLIVVEYRGFII